jgi:endonuclease-8
MPDALVCDALLDQTVFSGVGNIIKNEVLFRIRMHPLSRVGALPAPKLRELVAQARQYSFDFLAWKKAFVLKQHWLAHTKTICPRCEIPFVKAHLGKTQRRSFFCENCQQRYEAPFELR